MSKHLQHEWGVGAGLGVEGLLKVLLLLPAQGRSKRGHVGVHLIRGSIRVPGHAILHALSTVDMGSPCCPVQKAVPGARGNLREEKNWPELPPSTACIVLYIR